MTDLYNITGPTMMMNGTISNSFINDSYDINYDNGTSVKVALVKPYDLPVKIFRLMMYSVVCLLGTVGNGLVIWFCLFRMEKTVNVIWFLNLAMVDFSISLVLPLDFTYVALDGHWPFGNVLCKFSWFLFFINIFISVFQLTIISVDRCICVVFPVWCHNHRKRRLALIVVLIIWVISISLNLPTYIFSYTVGGYKIDCIFNDEVIWLQTVRFIFFFLVPFIITISCYTVIVLRLKEKKLKSSKPFKIIVAVVIAFFVCWFPYYLFVLKSIFQITINDTVELFGSEISMGLMFFNSCINPVLYVLIGRDFKEKFCGSFQAIFEKAFKEDTDNTNLK